MYVHPQYSLFPSDLVANYNQGCCLLLLLNQPTRTAVTRYRRDTTRPCSQRSHHHNPNSRLLRVHLVITITHPHIHHRYHHRQIKICPHHNHSSSTSPHNTSSSHHHQPPNLTSNSNSRTNKPPPSHLQPRTRNNQPTPSATAPKPQAPSPQSRLRAAQQAPLLPRAPNGAISS